MCGCSTRGPCELHGPSANAMACDAGGTAHPADPVAEPLTPPENWEIIEGLTAERDSLRSQLAEARELLADAARQINCSGPVAHRIRVLKQEHAEQLTREVEARREAERQRDEARRWVADLQAGCYVNCVYCGHRYGPDPDTPVAMADVLKDHIAQCREHPLSHAMQRAERLTEALRRYAMPGEDERCRVCEATQWGTHTQDCPLAALLAEQEG